MRLLINFYRHVNPRQNLIFRNRIKRLKRAVLLVVEKLVGELVLVTGELLLLWDYDSGGVVAVALLVDLGD